MTAVLFPARLAAAPSPGNRLAYLDESSPFYAGAGFPRLTAPMWAGEEGVEAVIIFSIDDLRAENVEKYRAMLPPILAKLREVEGHSPLSIFTNRIDPGHPQLQEWLEQGVRLDVHTRSHPCPLLAGDFAKAAADVFDCIDNLSAVPGPPPVAFRMPCCDSINSASPRFYSEILPRRTPQGRFLEIDSSVVMFLKEADRAYAPFRNYAANALGYPYPYIINRLIWEFPIIAPSDWQAQHRRGPNQPQTVEDLKAGIDDAVAAQGLYTFCFHPHGWIRSDQVVELIDHVSRKHGRKARFLNFHEALERLNKNLLGGFPLRSAGGSDNGVRLLDLNRDGYLDVVIGNDEKCLFRLWNPPAKKWEEGDFPFRLVSRAAGGEVIPTGVRFGILQENGFASALAGSELENGLAHFDGRRWARERNSPLEGLLDSGKPVATAAGGRDRGARLRDVDGDGFSDLIVNNELQNAVFRWHLPSRRFIQTPWKLPSLSSIVDAAGKDRGLRFADVNGDAFDDAFLSNDDEYYLYLYTGSGAGWSRRALHGPAGSSGALPRTASRGEEVGAWVREGVLYAASEETAKLPDLVETRSFPELLQHMASPPLEAEAALRQFKVPAGFQVELAAAEPLVEDPVAFDFAPDGRLLVVEMGSYPRGEGADSGGRVKILRDRDGDGRADEAALFASGLTFPSGVLSFGKGVLVTCAPEILYFEDTDGDGRADVKRAIFTGFGEGNHQHRVNGLRFGIDNWIYGANGDSGGEIALALQPGVEPVSIRGRDFRFSRDFKILEAVSGRTQYGLAMDDFGNRFGCSNARHLLHAVLPEHYLGRNPHYAPPDPVLDIPDHGAMARVYPISRELISLNDIHVPNHFSSACGLTIYRGDQFPEEYRGSAFVCEPVANLVHRDVLAPDGATFTARRGEEKADFLASTDNWFRPVYLATGPDGALYVADMYRWVIEHPDYIPLKLHQILDFTAGRDRGRIYRVVCQGGSRGRPLHPDLSRESAGKLASRLEHPNGWWRDAAQRLLVERQDKSAIPQLARLLRQGSAAPARLHALWTLEGLGTLGEEELAAALDDPHPALREHALRIAEKRSAGQPWRGKILDAANDGDFHVRLQAAFSLGEIDGAAAGAALASVARKGLEDPWLRAAVLSSSLPHAGRLLQELFAGKAALPPENPAAGELLNRLLAILVRRGDRGEIQAVLRQLVQAEKPARWHFSLLGAWLESQGTEAAGLLDQNLVQTVRASARAVAADPSRDVAERAEAAKALGPDLASAEKLAIELLSPRQPVELQLAAVRTLAQAAPAAGGKSEARLLAAWTSAGPQVRSEMLQALLAREESARELLAAIERGDIRPLQIDLESRKRLRESESAELRARAERLFAPEGEEDREQVVSRYLKAVSGLKGDARRGREVFLKICSTCHLLEGEGHAVGPDLAQTRSKDSAYLIEAILNPGRMVPPQYSPYVVEKRDRQIATGIIAAESATAITLLRANGVTETILRVDLRRLESSGGTLMPAELEKEIPPEDMAHLLEFLKETAKPFEALTAEEMAANKEEALKSGHNGLSRVLRSAGQAPQASWAGLQTLHYARQRAGVNEIAWQTEPAPQPLHPASRLTFRFPAALGFISQPEGSFALYLGDRKLLDFGVTLDSARWKSADGQVALRYRARARNAEDSTGLMELELPASLLEPGQPATLHAVGTESGSNRWFGLLPLR
ncbi:MAG: c-type cytochrome [Planctomycetes bacterium]|nr:c-type cytochrome [Planctomycetota bacterium]